MNAFPRRRLSLLFTLLWPWLAPSDAVGRAHAAVVTTWPAPPGEPLAEGVTLRVEGQPVPVHHCRVSAIPFNQVWPGYQRPLDQTEAAGFASWDQSGPVRVELTLQRAFTNVTIRPGRLGIQPRRSGQTLSFTLPQPGAITVETDGPHHALHLFAHAPETNAPAPGTPGVRYFGPGVHRPGKLQLASGETLYLAGGAVVHTSVQANGASGIRILGRGLIDASGFERDQGGGCIRLTGCTNVHVEGVVLRDPDVWCLSAFGCRDLTIADVQLVGLWRYNADGIDLCNSENVVVRHCFVRAFDDAIVLKGLNWGRNGFSDRPVRNIRVHDNVIWCDWGRALEIGAETSAPEFTDIRFRDCDIIRTTHIAMDIQCGDRALVHDVRYDRIRVETDDVAPTPRIQSTREEKYALNPRDEFVPDLMVIVIARNPYSQDTERGNVRDVVYNDIQVRGLRPPRSWFQGLDAQHQVRDIRIGGLRHNDRPLTNAALANLSLGAHTTNVTFAAGAAPEAR